MSIWMGGDDYRRFYFYRKSPNKGELIFTPKLVEFTIIVNVSSFIILSLFQVCFKLSK